MSIITLSNGKRVANFSSPHDFVFEDGSILPAHSNEEAERLKVTFHEKEHSDGDIELSFSLSEGVYDEMQYWLEQKRRKLVDVVFCPLPMMTALKQYYNPNWILKSPFRTIRMVSRTDKKVSITKQCI